MSPNPMDLLIAKASEHGTLLPADKAALGALHLASRKFEAGDDIVRQGDRPDVAIFVFRGMIGRYHTVANGDRQYLSLHIRGDMPDVQSLLLQQMDHSICAIDAAEIVLIQHDSLRKAFVERPALAFAFWRLTLVDAAIFREAITNNSARRPAARIAHLCCEQYVRAVAAGLSEDDACDLPLSQLQLGQLLGMSQISAHRSLQILRQQNLLEFRAGKLVIKDWAALSELAQFDPTYLHLTKDSETSRMAFGKRQ
jgi:CRP-like cAMP-binding protein